MEEERIKKRLAELVRARAAYETEAKAQMMGFDAAIGELQALLGEEGCEGDQAWRDAANFAGDQAGN